MIYIINKCMISIIVNDFVHCSCVCMDVEPIRFLASTVTVVLYKVGQCWCCHGELKHCYLIIHACLKAH